MKSIKEFLKPNWWKAIVFLVIAVFAVIFGYQKICNFDSPLLPAPAIYPLPFSFDSSYCETTFSPWLWLGLKMYLPLDKLPQAIYHEFTGIEPWWGIFVVASLMLILIYWYLLACLIYFIVVKIKRLIAKPK